MAGPAAAQIDEAKRFAEIVAILQKHHLVQGLTPEKVRDIFVDLGPTFVKFGQILSMRSDILPKEYCAALETLRTDVTPMPLTEVEDILTQAYARPWQEVFSDIGIRPLGSASIAQVHAATLTDGQRVVVKVQRPDLYDTMSRDVRLLKRAASLLKYTPLASALDFHAVLDEMWHTVQEELDFTIEANNIAEFKRLNDGVAYADCPATFPKWCTKNVLVMEYIAGHQIDDADGLRADGYDLNEIAVKLVHNYIRQITVYRFFHADPHPGNIRVQGGKKPTDGQTAPKAEQPAQEGAKSKGQQRQKSQPNRKSGARKLGDKPAGENVERSRAKTQAPKSAEGAAPNGEKRTDSHRRRHRGGRGRSKSTTPGNAAPSTPAAE